MIIKLLTKRVRPLIKLFPNSNQMLQQKFDSSRTNVLSPPAKLQYSARRARSKTNNHKYQASSKNDYNDNSETKGKQRLHKTGRKYSQSHGLLHPYIKNQNNQTKNMNGKMQKYGSKDHITMNISKPRSRNISSLAGLNMNSLHLGSNIQQIRSKVMSVHSQDPQYEVNLLKNNPYDNFVKQLNIKLPSPQQKFKQFIRIPPFNRLKNHTQFISHMLKKSFTFFSIHPSQIINNIAKKIVQVPLKSIPNNYIIILYEGSCTYNSKNIQKGCLVCRERFNAQNFSYEGDISLIGMPSYQYSMFVSQYLNQNMEKFKKFMQTIQIFKIFTHSALEKIFTSINLFFFSKGQNLYEPGQQANHLFLIYQGSAARRIIVQIDKTNKIPIQKYSKLIKVLSRSYEHRIRFHSEDLVGVADIVQKIYKRSQDLVIDENATIISIDRSAIEQNLDEYIIDRLKKYNLKKYPKNYDELCQNYLKQKVQNRKAEQRKIAALKDEMTRDNNNERKTQKINGIIKMYQQRIKVQEKQHLIQKKKIERIVQNQT